MTVLRLLLSFCFPPFLFLILLRLFHGGYEQSRKVNQPSSYEPTAS
jgi:hypothetical protein